MNRRRCAVTPFMYAKRASKLGVWRGTPLFAKRRAIFASSHGKVSTSVSPSGGRNDAAKISSRTLAVPNLLAIPGSVMPPIEWPTMTMSVNPVLSMSPMSESTQSAIDISFRLPGLPRRPGMSRASTVKSGANRWISSIVSFQESAASPPPCTRTNAGSAMAGLLERRESRAQDRMVNPATMRRGGLALIRAVAAMGLGLRHFESVQKAVHQCDSFPVAARRAQSLLKDQGAPDRGDDNGQPGRRVFVRVEVMFADDEIQCGDLHFAPTLRPGRDLRTDFLAVVGKSHELQQQSGVLGCDEGIPERMQWSVGP